MVHEDEKHKEPLVWQDKVALFFFALGVALALLLVSSWLATFAHAHPVDDPCPPGKVTEDGCQPVVRELCLDNPEYFRAHKSYWHCRRLLVAHDTVDYAMLVGEALKEWRECRYPRGVAAPVIDWGLLSYWERIPAHPELDFACAVWRAEEQSRACEATRGAAAIRIQELSAEIARLRRECAKKKKR